MKMKIIKEKYNIRLMRVTLGKRAHKIILLFIFLIFIILHLIFIFNKRKVLNEKYDTIRLLPREEALDSGLAFIKKCVEGILINDKKFEKVENPRVSVIIPCYNCGQFIKKSLCSIQNQNMKDIEIIIVDDYSNKETVDLLNELKKEEPRLEIYHNDKNMKLFYTRCFGVLKARGKYVLNLDSDDMLFDSDVLDALYIAAEDGNFDIIANKRLNGYDYYNKSRIKDNQFNNKEHNLKIYQPELSCYIISSNGQIKYNDVYISDKFIRASVYKSAINLIGKDVYSIPLIWQEDNIILYIISNLASSYKFIGKYCYFYFIGGNSTSSRLNRNDKVYGDLFKVNIILDLSKKDCYNIPVKYLMQDAKPFIESLNEINQNFLKNIVYKIMHSQHIDEQYKNYVKYVFRHFLPNDSNNNNNNPVNNM